MNYPKLYKLFLYTQPPEAVMLHLQSLCWQWCHLQGGPCRHYANGLYEDTLGCLSPWQHVIMTLLTLLVGQAAAMAAVCGCVGAGGGGCSSSSRGSSSSHSATHRYRSRHQGLSQIYKPGGTRGRLYPVHTSVVL